MGTFSPRSISAAGGPVLGLPHFQPAMKEPESPWADLNFSESDWGSIRPVEPNSPSKSTIAHHDSAVSRLDSHQLTIGPKAMATLMSARRYSQSVEPQHHVGRPSCNVL
jgi:hypothetical protein